MLQQNPQSPPASADPAVKDAGKVEAPIEMKKTENLQAEGIYQPARLAQAYVLWQKYGRTFTPAEALEKGTLFPDLYSPYPY